jgi:RimJ/RimL family protein N-acetyltransferase
MNSMPRPTMIRVRNGLYYLCDFVPRTAAVVSTWARDPHELFWLAPSTPPPLTPARVLAWMGADVCPMLLGRDQSDDPLGYLEINLMPGQPGHLWMGHCVIEPDRRGQGLGQIMVDLALDDAFTRRHAESVSLVVFPDNQPALACYRAVGFEVVGEQIKDFPTSDRPHRMLRMCVTVDRYRELRAARPPL